MLVALVGLAAVALPALGRGGSPDRRGAGPDITVSWPEPQHSTRAVRLEIECRSDCSVRVKGKLAIPRAENPTTGVVTRPRDARLKPVSERLEARREEKLRLRIPRKARPSLDNAFAAGEVSEARIKVSHSDAVGRSRVRAKIELQAP